MYSNEDLERFYFQYQTEALPHGESIQSFCLKNNVPYNIFSKWYKDTRKQIVEVKVDGSPSCVEKASVQSVPICFCCSNVRDFSDMRYKHNRVLSIIREQLHGMSCWRYLGEFFKKTVQASEKNTCFQFSECSLSYAKIFNGCRDFFSLTPENIVSTQLRSVKI